MTEGDPQTPQPGMEAGPPKKLRVAAVGDLHVGEAHDRPYRELFDRVHEDADVLVLCGDLTNFRQDPGGGDPSGGHTVMQDPHGWRAGQSRA